MAEHTETYLTVCGPNVLCRAGPAELCLLPRPSQGASLRRISARNGSASRRLWAAPEGLQRLLV